MTGGQRVRLKRVKHRLNARQSLRINKNNETFSQGVVA
jgi:hypothetical protein